VRRFIVDNALMWIRDYHCDGLRLDAVHAIADESERHILEQISEEVEALGAQLRREVVVIAESDANDPRLVRPREAGGYGLDAVWSDDWHHALHAVLTGERTGYYADFGSLAMLGKALRQAWVYDGTWSARRQATRGSKATGVTNEKFLIAAQNHDQVGNRAIGERLGALVDESALKVAAALLLTAPFTPMLFQGEEWASSSPFLYFTDHADPKLGEAVRKGRRREFAAFGWEPEKVPDPQDAATFQLSKLHWNEPHEPFHERMLEWYRALIQLRKRLPDDGVRVEVDEDLGRVAVERDGVGVRVNLGRSGWQLPIPPGMQVLMASDPDVAAVDDMVCVPPSGVVIFEKQ
jgi:maltooligosyltrehalose trehalohydrolase